MLSVHFVQRCLQAAGREEHAQEFALADIIGGAFYEFIQLFVSSTVTPLLRAAVISVTSPEKVIFPPTFISGGFVLAKGGRYDNAQENQTIVSTPA